MQLFWLQMPLLVVAWTTAIHCLEVSQNQTSGNYSAYKTVQPESQQIHQDIAILLPL